METTNTTWMEQAGCSHARRFVGIALAVMLVVGCTGPRKRVAGLTTTNSLTTQVAAQPHEAPTTNQAPGHLMRTDTLDPEMADLSIHTISTVSEPLVRPAGGEAVRLVSLVASVDLCGVILSQSHAFMTMPAASHEPVSLLFSGLDTSLATMSAEFLLTGEVMTTEPGPALPAIRVHLAPGEGNTWGSAGQTERDLLLSVTLEK